MARISKLKVTYRDGSVVEVKVRPRAQIETERHIAGDWETMAILSVYYMAWSSLRIDDKEIPDFETWIDRIDDVEQVEGKDPDPTEPAQSTDSSSI